MSSHVLAADSTGLQCASPPLEAAGRWALSRSVLAWTVRAGLIGGLVFGWALTVRPGLRFAGVMGLRQWADALSYSALVHAILWTVHGAIIGSVCGVAVLASGRLRRGVVPGALALAVVVAGTGTFWLWCAAVEAGLSLAKEIDPSWWVVMAGFWLLVAAGAYAIACVLTPTRLGVRMRTVGRSGFLPAAGIVLVCLAIQWFERPQLMASEGLWQSPSVVSQDRQDARPNIVLVVMDTQRVDRLGCYGYGRQTSPRLDAFAADATVFENCTSPAIWTLPAHASMFTGLFPSEHGANWGHTWVAEEFTTVTQLLAEAGYQTMALTNNLWIGPSTNLSRGFDGYIQPLLLHNVRSNGLAKLLLEALYPGGHVGKWLGVATAQDDGAKYTNQLLERFLRQRDRHRPFFLFVNYMEAHAPYVPHLPYKKLFIEPADIDGSYRHAWWSKRPEFCLLKRDCFTPAQLELLNDTYNAETRLQDDYLGGLLAMLAEHVSVDDTLIIVTADHGECLGDHHIIGHAWCVYETLAHVPLIIRYPKRLKPGRRADPVQTVDLFPTMLDALYGRTGPTQSTFGRSLLDPTDATSGPSTASATPAAATTSPSTAPTDGPSLPTGRVVVVEYMAPYDVKLDQAQKIDSRFDRAPFEGVLRAVRQGPWKYIVASNGREELYNVAEDPREASNLITSHRPIADHLAKQLSEWLAASKPYQAPERLAGKQQLDEETRSRLRGLGYIQ